MNFILSNFSLILLFFIDFSWSSWTYHFNGSSTDCDDTEIEKYIKPEQSFGVDPVWKEHGNYVLNSEPMLENCKS